MATRIPLPSAPGESLMKGIDTGSTMFSRLMQPILEREKQKQLEEHFQEQLKLSKASAGRNAALFKYRLQELQDKHAASEFDRNMMGQLFGGNEQPLNEPNESKSVNDGYPALNKMFEGQGAFPGGEIEHGNLDLNNRPQVPNPETGGASTVWSMSIGTPKGEVLIPRVSDDGRILTPAEAQDQFHRTGKHMGIYSSPEEATKASQMIHEQQAASVGAKPGNNLLDVLRADPVKRAYFKYKFKFDPLAVEKGDVLHGPARDASDLAKLKTQVGENSEVYQNAKAAYDAQLDAKKDLRDLRARTKSGLKAGEKEFYDEKTGAPLGKEIPLTAKERESEEGNILFNELYPYVYKGASSFSGEGSIRRLEQAASNYKSDPKARKLFDDYLLAEKMMAATTVNEASTLKAGHTNQTYNRLQASLEAQDIPKIVKKLIKEYGVPSSAQLRAAMRYQKLLSNARIKARKSTPATQKLFYNPEMQAQHESGQLTGNTEPKAVIVLDPNGKRFETTEENAAHLPKGWKRG